ncbi:hypothetical protein N9X06_04160 [Paracoccaceae bacterium]|nr:hypothetical protein [Paracoccaceae bacterium]
MLKNTQSEILNVYIGFDEKETVAYHTLSHSIISRATKPIRISPICSEHYKNFFNRQRDPKQSNDFSFTRFLVPFLNDYEGHAIFMDCDMMLRDDIFKVFDEIDSANAISVVQHDYTPSETVKYLNNVQYVYPRKNWSSFVVWNCAHPKHRILTPEYVQHATGLELHRFKWLNDNEIGSLDVNWNWLVGDYVDPSKDVKNVHWTIGGPYFKEFSDVDFSSEWFEMHKQANFCMQKE